MDDVFVEVDLRELLSAAQTTGAEDVDLHQLVTDDVQADEKHAVLNQFGSHDLGDSSGLEVTSGRRQLSACVNVAAHVATAADATKRGVLALYLQGPSVHDEQPHVAFFRGWQVFLSRSRSRHG